MNKYKLHHFILSGILGGIFMLLAGCGGLPSAEKIVIPALEAKKPITTANTPARQAMTRPVPRASTNNTIARQTPVARPAPRKAKPRAAAKPTITRANQLMRSGKKAAAAEMYYASAFSYRPPQRERIILQAAEISMSIGNHGQAGRYLKTAAAQQLTPLNQIRYRYIKSLLALHNKQPNQTLALLPANTNGLPKGLRDKIELVRKYALTQTQNNTRQQTASATRKITTNQPSVSYQAQRNASGQQQNPANYDPNSQPAGQSPTQQNQPAQMRPMLPATISRVAVLLPDSGKLATVGDEIYQGIRDAQASYGSSLRVKRYQVNKASITGQYQQAMNDGADIVIGPLSKDTLTSLMAQPTLLSTPILSLNYLSGTQQLPHALYQFGLSPEDEARQIAALALQRGQINSVVMVPDSAWGKRLGNAFAQAYQQSGGQVLHAATYPASKPSAYLKRVQSLPGEAEGANMVFLAASPTQARLLHPLIKAQAGLIPVYATSHIFSGREARNKDIDLDGIIYTEIPYILSKSGQGSLDKLKYPRLYALGRDSLMIAKNLAPLIQRQTLGGQTGQISMTQERRMQRQLEFATFANGKPQSLAQ